MRSTPRRSLERRRALARAAGRDTPVFALSGVSGEGVPQILGAVFQAIRDARADDMRDAGLADV